MCRSDPTAKWELLDEEEEEGNHFLYIKMSLTYSPSIFFSFHYTCNAQQHIYKLHQFTDDVIDIVNHVHTLVGSKSAVATPDGKKPKEEEEDSSRIKRLPFHHRNV